MVMECGEDAVTEPESGADAVRESSEEAAPVLMSPRVHI